ncbi:hypothetical protein PIB30_042346 [Stylosanthes scabra]|uniref:Uncharacterized protein n=1 Tax=Stylosanthes scabra TaxID=79078 RepID=A0ABU6SGU3_9FABA|nr:hypothetical protein [Stylosanthes scabra]
MLGVVDARGELIQEQFFYFGIARDGTRRQGGEPLTRRSGKSGREGSTFDLVDRTVTDHPVLEIIEMDMGVGGSVVFHVGSPTSVAVPSRGRFAIIQTTVVTPFSRRGLGSLSPPRWEARLGSGTPSRWSSSARLLVPRGGSEIGILFSQFSNLQLHRLHAMSQLLGDLGFVRSNSAERSGGQTAWYNPVESTLSIAMDWIMRGRLPVLDSSRIRISITISGGFVSCGVEV